LIAVRPLARSAVITAIVVLAVTTLASAVTPVGEWTPFDGGPDAVCADGSAVNYLERAADPGRVVLYFEGGGACFSAATCAFEGEENSYISSSEVTPEAMADRGGIFDASNPENPLADCSFVYVPYCTGDVHLGNKTTDYSADLSVEHRGFVNATAALDHLVETHPDATDVVVTGSSGGSVPTPLYAGLAADVLPGARIVTLGDSSGVYPDDPVLNAFVGSMWGSMDAIPDWPETEGVTVREWSIPGLYRYAGWHAPGVTFARFDYAHDDVQAFYGGLVGVAADELVTLIDQNETDTEAAGVEVASYTAPGTRHTILGMDAFYELEVEGVRFVDWFTDLVGGDTPADVHCTDCD